MNPMSQRMKKIIDGFLTVFNKNETKISVVFAICFFSIFFYYQNKKMRALYDNVAHRAVGYKEAMFYTKLKNDTVDCLLCPWQCRLKNGQRGFCLARVNVGGSLYSTVYGKAFLGVLEHDNWGLIYASTKGNMLLIGPPGCNMRCDFCLSADMAIVDPAEIKAVNFRAINLPFSGGKANPDVSIFRAHQIFKPLLAMSPEDVIATAKKYNCKIIAYVMTEPTPFYEFMLDVAKLARKNGLKNALGTNGYINKRPLEELLKYMDGVSVGLKGFRNDVYQRYVHAELNPVLETLKVLKDNDIGFEITYPLIPGVNDDLAQLTAMCSWIKDNLGVKTPLNFYKFLPLYRLSGVPPTSKASLDKAKKIANDVGLQFVYYSYLNTTSMPNPDQEINCPSCKRVVLSRKDGVLTDNTKKGRCRFCNERISFLNDD